MQGHDWSPAQRYLRTALWVGAIVAVAATASESETWDFDVRPGGTLNLETDFGSIDVRTTDADTVTVTVNRQGERADDLVVKATQDGNDVNVSTEWTGDSQRGWGGNSARVKFDVTVPRRFDVNLTTRGGSIAVDDLNGKLDADTSGGSLKFGRIEGRVRARTSGGSIRVAGGGADVDVRTSGGSIDIGDVSGPVVAKTSGGSISVDKVRGSIRASTSGGSVRASITEKLDGDSSLATSGGSVRVEIDDSLGLEIDAKAGSGGVRSEIPLDGETRADRHLRGELNGGGPKLTLRSNGGGIRIQRH